MTIGKRLKEFRTMQRLTAAELASALGIPVRTAGSYERDETQPGTKFYLLMSEKFGININWLITGRGAVFAEQELPRSKDSIVCLQEKIKFSNDDMKTMLEILNSEAGRSMILKLIQVKRGNKEALNSLLENLRGIKAVL